MERTRKPSINSTEDQTRLKPASYVFRKLAESIHVLQQSRGSHDLWAAGIKIILTTAGIWPAVDRKGQDEEKSHISVLIHKSSAQGRPIGRLVNHRRAIPSSLCDPRNSVIKSITGETTCPIRVVKISVRMRPGNWIVLDHFLIVPDASRNLTSEPPLQTAGYKIHRDGTVPKMCNSNGKRLTVCDVREFNDMMPVVGYIEYQVKPTQATINSVSVKLISAYIVHRRYAQMNERAARAAESPSDPPVPVTAAPISDCVPCIMGKQTRHTQRRKADLAPPKPNMRLHMDICGPFDAVASDGSA